MAAIDVAGFVADLKDHAVTHGFHVHDERHFVETYSLRQAWEVDLHPEDGCGGPVDLHIELDVDPRTLLAFEDAVLGLPDEVDPPDEFHFPLVLTWSLPPMPNGPDLLRLAIDLAPIGGLEMPLEVTATDAFASPTESSERRISIVARRAISLESGRQGRGPPLRHLRTRAQCQRLLVAGCRLVARVARVLVPIAALVLASVALSACGTSGAVTDARASCVLVKRALAIQRQSETPNLSATRRARLEGRAMSELLKATPKAADATSIDGSWNALMTTINESERVPLKELVPSLTRLCKVADSSTPYL